MVQNLCQFFQRVTASGIKEQLIFPEVEYDKVDKVRGMDIIFVTTANTDEEARELLKLFNMPFCEISRGTFQS